ncbi:alpha/beta fold hydrolase [Alkalicoccus chagannorensis]|uniref:alpha/beta fold hydrolase n=1 Tax=Alkalicoccus chagannorensis TaxID=427072 RepID=UPI0004297CF3|nr:alpha/beta hydrolase [Alkalicoccus chagannorensis]
MTNEHLITADTFRERQQSVMMEGIIDEPVEIRYTDVGSGPPLLLLHGIPTWSYLFQEMITELQDDYRVIVPDMLGYGYSDHRDRFDRSLHVQAEVVKRLMDELGLLKVHFVGHDIGGGVGLVLAVNDPDRLDTMMLANTIAYDSWPIEAMLKLGHPSWTEKPISEVQSFLESAFQDGILHDEQRKDRFVEGITAPYTEEEGRKSLVRNAAALNTNETTMLTHKLPEVQVPSLILWGTQDPWQQADFGRRLAEDLPHGSFVGFDDSGHWLPQEAPAAFAAEVKRFVQQRGSL